VKTPKEKFIEEFKVKKDKFSKAVSEWTDEEMTEYLKAAEDIYHHPFHAASLLGKDLDPNMKYYWHTFDPRHPENDALKLQRRLESGWVVDRFAGDVGETRSGDSSRMSVTTVDKNCKGGLTSIRLRMPTDLWNLRMRIKADLANRKALFDENGKPRVSKITKQTDKIQVVETDEGSVGINDLK
jgi:hypothetical protein